MFVAFAARVFIDVTLCLCRMQMAAADFITADKLDSAIEAALNSHYINSFAIDLHGNRYIEQADGSTVIRSNSEQQQLTTGSWTEQLLLTKGWLCEHHSNIK